MEAQTSEPCCKVSRVAEAYTIPNLDSQLVQRREQGNSLRDLATYINKNILSAALDLATREVVSDADSIYEVLTGENVKRDRRAELRSKLNRSGVDIDDIQRDFVSHQTVRNHLHDCREIDTGRESTVDVEGGRKTIEWAQARSESVIEQTLERLRSVGEITDSPTEITQSVRVGCHTCGKTYPIEEFLERRGCDCGETSKEE